MNLTPKNLENCINLLKQIRKDVNLTPGVMYKFNDKYIIHNKAKALLEFVSDDNSEIYNSKYIVLDFKPKIIYKVQTEIIDHELYNVRKYVIMTEMNLPKDLEDELSSSRYSDDEFLFKIKLDVYDDCDFELRNEGEHVKIYYMSNCIGTCQYAKYNPESNTISNNSWSSTFVAINNIVRKLRSIQVNLGNNIKKEIYRLHEDLVDSISFYYDNINHKELIKDLNQLILKIQKEGKKS